MQYLIAHKHLIKKPLSSYNIFIMKPYFKNEWQITKGNYLLKEVKTEYPAITNRYNYNS